MSEKVSISPAMFAKGGEFYTTAAGRNTCTGKADRLASRTIGSTTVNKEANWDSYYTSEFISPENWRFGSRGLRVQVHLDTETSGDLRRTNELAGEVDFKPDEVYTAGKTPADHMRIYLDALESLHEFFMSTEHDHRKVLPEYFYGTTNSRMAGAIERLGFSVTAEDPYDDAVDVSARTSEVKEKVMSKFIPDESGMSFADKLRNRVAGTETVNKVLVSA